MPLLTVGMPVFNAMPYLPESLESILRQTYTDFEILVINDGSTDGSWEYLQSIHDSRLRLVNQGNCGLTATLNRMLTETTSPWLVRQDADDVACPTRLARTAQGILEYPESGVFHSFAAYYPKGSVGQFRTTKGSPGDIRRLVLAGYLPSICHPTVTLNVEKVVSVGGYRFDLHVEDIDLWWRVALEFDIRLIPKVTIGFRQNLQSVSSAHLETQALNTLYVQYLLISHLCGREPLCYEQVRTPLAALVDSRHLKFKEHLRAFNMDLGRGHRLTGLYELTRALVASPTDFSRRILDEILPNRAVAVGEPAVLFEERENELWASAAQTSSERVSTAATETKEATATPRAGVWHINPQSRQIAEGATDPVKIRPVTAPSFPILGIRVHAMTKSDLISSVNQAVRTQAQYIIGNHNLHSLYCWFHESKMREFHATANYTHIDGMSLILLGRMLGFPLHRRHRTGYVDFLPSLAEEAAKNNWRIFYLGSKPGIAEKGAQILREKYSGIQIRTHHGHFNLERSGHANQELLAEIGAYAPHILLVGMGMPRQEIWILENKDQISANAVFCCGALLDYVAGEIPTPPRWIGALGLEWLCRLAAEPSRLWYRYLVEPWFIIGQIAWQYFLQGPEGGVGGPQE
jgi:exopolysaccharide biosynthesis WecB/TagA/CpsF family protein